MHIINVMFGRGLGGIEQASVDYAEALIASGHKVTAIIYPQAPIKEQFAKIKANIVEVKNLGGWDFFAKSYLRKVLGQANPDAVICHGNRAIALLKAPASERGLPVIGVTHNYSLKHMKHCDAVFATTKDLRREVIKRGMSSHRVFDIPNMVRISTTSIPKPTEFHKPIIIGAMGRFVSKKGFKHLVNAMSLLVKRGVDVELHLGGVGPEQHALELQVADLKLSNKVKFLGWVDDKQAFFDSIDIFCLPSLHEPFGIILLEAFAALKPVVTADAEGPSEIATNHESALIVPRADSDALANAIDSLIANEPKAHALSRIGFITAQNYSLSRVGERLHTALTSIVK